MVVMKKENEPLGQSVGENGRVSVPEEMATVEAPKRAEENLEITSWVEKIEKKFARVPNDTADVNDDQVVVQPQAQTQQPPVTLPINQQQMAKGKNAKPDLGIAWLVTWVIRQIKLLSRTGRKVKLQDMPEVK
jgi:hypothetical protein